MNTVVSTFQRYRRKPVGITALRQDHIFTIQTPDGVMTGRAGDWLVMDEHGIEQIIVDATFRKLYEPVDYKAEAMFDGVY